VFPRCEARYDPLSILNPGCIIPAADWAPLAALKVGEDAAAIPDDIAARLRDLERTAGLGDPQTRARSLMEIFRDPRVTLLARPEFVEPEHLKVQWKGEATDCERLAEYAGRLCYMSQHHPINRTTSEYLENIKKQGQRLGVGARGVTSCSSKASRAPARTELVRHPRRVRLLSDLAALLWTSRTRRSCCRSAMLGDAALEAAWERQVTEAQAAYVRAVEGLMQRYDWLADKVHRRSWRAKRRAACCPTRPK